MRIQKTYIPEERLTQNEWFKTFNVSSRLTKWESDNKSKEMNLEYNFSKFEFLCEEEHYFSKILKYFKFISI